MVDSTNRTGSILLAPVNTFVLASNLPGLRAVFLLIATAFLMPAALRSLSMETKQEHVILPTHV